MIDRIYEYSKSVDSCRICNKRQLSRITNNRPQFDINQAIKFKNSVIYNEHYEQDSEFTLRSLNEYLVKCNVNENGLIDLKSYLKTEEFDSDAVIDDIQNEEWGESSVSKWINESIIDFNTDNYFHLVKKFLNYHRFPTYQQGK
eukprot:460607_1